jgi:hypothetical protein
VKSFEEEEKTNELVLQDPAIQGGAHIILLLSSTNVDFSVGGIGEYLKRWRE